MNFETHIQMSELLDIYGCMLTARQLSVMEQYIYEDCSLQEIAERESVSRQAVRDAICAAQNKLSEYETMLGFAKKVRDTVSTINKIKNMLDDGEAKDVLCKLTDIWN